MALILAMWGCGGEADGAPRFVVDRTPLTWSGTARSDQVLERRWAGAPLLSDWRPVGGVEAATSAGRTWWLHPGALTVVGPAAEDIDRTVFHWVRVRVAATGVATVVAAWGPAGELGGRRRSAPVEVVADGTPRDVLIPLRGLRSAQPGGDVGDETGDVGDEAGGETGTADPARDGSAPGRLRLRFQGDEASQLRVSVDEIALGSVYQDPDGRGFVETRLDVRGVQRAGLALRAPGRVQTHLLAAPGDRLALGLAAVGAPAGLTVRVDLGGARHELTCGPGGDWQDHVLEVGDPPAGRPRDGPVPLSLEVVEASDPHATLLIGGLLHLRRTDAALPDIVVYLEDTLRADHLTTYGARRATDPHLRRIADQGAVFERAFSTSNWTRPAVSSLMTSLLPSSHGNDGVHRRVPDTLTLLAEVLAERGYLTASFVTNFQAGSWAGLHQGFDIHSERGAEAAAGGTTLTSQLIAGPLDELLGRYEGVPLFVYAHSLDPHKPYAPPAGLRDRLVSGTAEAAGVSWSGTPEDRERQRLELMADTGSGPASLTSVAYDAEVLHNDGQLDRLDRALRRHGRWDDTVLVFTSDHGEAFGEHGLWMHRQGLYQPELHVPLIVRWPGRVPEARRLSQPVSLIDVAPTLLGLIGAPRPPGWSGRDLSAWLLGDVAGQGDPPPLLAETLYADDHPRPGRELAVVRWPYKLIARAPRAGGPWQPVILLDLEADPGETEDLIRTTGSERIVEALLEWAQRTMGAPAPGGHPDGDPGGEAHGLDGQLEEWLRAMGYLR